MHEIVLKMAEFKDGGLWLRLAFLTMIIGFILDLFGFAIGIPAYWNDTLGLLIAGYLFFLTATFLILALVFLDEARGNMAAIICFIIASILAGECVSRNCCCNSKPMIYRFIKCS